MCDEKLYKEDEIDLFEYVRVIYKYRKVIAAVVFVSVFLRAGNVLMQPFKYQATATFFPLNVKQYKEANLEQLDLKPKLILEDLIISILNSREMADKIINDLGLKNIWHNELLMDARLALKNSTGISLTKGGVININVLTESGELSAKIANAYVDNLESFNKELQLSTDISLVQVIDRAVAPERRMPRGLIKKSMLSGLTSFFAGIFLVLILEYMKKSRFIEKIKTLK